MSVVSLLTRGSSTDAARRSDVATAGAVPSPPALRQRRSRWRDARLWLGVLLVVGSVLAGAKVLGAAGDTTAVWQLVRDVPAGSAVDGADVRVTRVHFDDAATAAHYLPATAPIAAGVHAQEDLHAGEMLAVAAVNTEPSPLRRQLPLGVASASAPADLRPGDHVEVWAVAAADAGTTRAGRTAPVKVLPDVVVLSVGSAVSGVSGDRQVLVGLTDDVDVGTVLTSVSNARVVLVRLAG